ncbi:MAG TPA: MarR family transcriptional regulator [Dehalococcoidia bacterium]|nr:MarR family transcriptional regulator [Dehalococcoidia bacterium]
MAYSTEDSVSWLLNYAGRLATRRTTSKLQTHGITPPQWAVLAQLMDQDGQSLSGLGSKALFDGPTMTGIVDRLETGGLVQRRRDSSDRRVINLYLTQKGRDLMAELPPIGRMTDEEILRGLSREEADCFIDTLRRIIARHAGDEDQGAA